MAIFDARREKTVQVATMAMALGSGFSGLVYEIVWFQQLSLILGASAISLTILLSSFMGGLCLGSLLIPHLTPASRRPLMTYARLEFLIALFGLAAFLTIPALGRTYTRWSFGHSTDLVVRATMAFVIMLPPTILMGGTLPIILRRLHQSSDRSCWVGWIYAANTFGAVCGSLAAGLYLLRCYDLRLAVVVAAIINCVVALSAVILNRWDNSKTPSAEPKPNASSVPNLHALPVPELKMQLQRRGQRGLIYLLVGLCGATALGAEVVWTRHLGLVLGPTVYSFSIILSVYLLGTGLGSSVGALLVDRLRSPKLGLAVAQFALVAATIYAAWATIAIVPSFLRLTGNHELFTVRVTRDFIRVAITILPATFLWGLSFPLAASTLANQTDDTGLVVGKLYAANTLGGIVGAAAVSLIGISHGGQFVQQVLASTCLLSGCVLILDWLLQPRTVVSSPSQKMALVPKHIIAACILILVPVASIYGIGLIPVTPVSLLAEGSLVDQSHRDIDYRFVAEGLNSPIVVSDLKDGTRCFHVAGKIEASTRERDLRTQRLLGHLPAMSCESPRKVLVVGCGSGITAGALLMHPTIEEIVICEIEPTVIDAAREHFGTHNDNVLQNPKTKVVHDDARHYLSTTRDTFDMITADPIHPWVKGSAALYTSEFFQLCRSRLNPDGIMTLWVPLYESNEAAVKCELATFFQTFPESSIWSGQGDRIGYDLVVVGSANNRPIDPQQLLSKLEANPPLQFSFAEMGLTHNDALRHRFVAYGKDLAPWLAHAAINRDHNLRLQYLAGTNPDYEIAQYLLSSMLEARDRASEDETPILSVISADEWTGSQDM